MPVWWPLPVVLAFVGSALLTPFVAFFATRFGVLDMPMGGRKIHQAPTPLLGGISVFVPFFISVLLVTFLSNAITGGEIGVSHILGFFVGGLILMFGGYLDDRYSLPPKFSILFPITAVLLATLLGIGVEKITNPFGGVLFLPPVFSLLFAFFWLLGMTYTTKLLDGVDGLASSVALIGGTMMVALALTEKYYQPDVVMIGLIFCAALFGFLLWNFYPAKIFLGEGGSTFIGFSLGVLAVIAGSKVATLLLVLGIPAIDLLTVMARRLFEGRSIVSGDRYHLHHLLFDNGLSERKVVLIYASLCTLFGAASLLFSSQEKVIALFVLTAFIIGLIFFLEKRKKRL